ncbi:uncharacterized protein LOC113304936 [Papaver somniferum]|uniref:uncharacterized protein LOC113304936 n=1 Tax=Papaver somniferum TaxID=3469 RepID=UPI000E704BAB|nr:uncharacterized protein LOC113304936 [Papaver somniferum]
MSKPSRMKHPTNRNYSSDNNPGIVEAIRNKTKEVLEEQEASRIAKEEEMGNKSKPKKKYKRKHDLVTPKPLRPRREDGKNLNASHRNRRGTRSKAKGISINDPPPQAEQPTHEKYDSETPTEQEGGHKQVEEEESDEEQSGAKEGGEEESDESSSDEEVNEEQSGGKEEQVQEEVQGGEVQQQVQGRDAQEQGKKDGKKKDGPKKKKGDHMPDPEKTFLRGPNDPVYGLPGDGGQMLWGYKDILAAVVFHTIDHKDVVRFMKPGTSVRLIPAVKNLDLGYDIPLCSSFDERYYGDTYTLHLPFGEMTITPRDAQLITGLSIEGNAVKHKGIRVGHLITQAMLEIMEGKNVKANEKIIDELNSLEDVEVCAKFGELEEEDEEPRKERKR